MVVVVPGTLAFLVGWFAFRSRVTGVYLSIITQAVTFALMLAFFRNDMGFGGNNGMTDFKDILGFNVQAGGTRAALFFASAAMLALGFLVAHAVVNSRLGKCWSPCAMPRAARASSATASKTTSCSSSCCRPAWPDRRRALCAAGRIINRASSRPPIRSKS